MTPEQLDIMRQVLTEVDGYIPDVAKLEAIVRVLIPEVERLNAYWPEQMRQALDGFTADSNTVLERLAAERDQLQRQLADMKHVSNLNQTALLADLAEARRERDEALEAVRITAAVLRQVEPVVEAAKVWAETDRWDEPRIRVRHLEARQVLAEAVNALPKTTPSQADVTTAVAHAVETSSRNAARDTVVEAAKALIDSYRADSGAWGVHSRLRDELAAAVDALNAVTDGQHTTAPVAADGAGQTDETFREAINETERQVCAAFLHGGPGVMLGRALSEWRSYWDDSGESGAPGDVELALVQAYDAVSAAGPDGEGQTEEVEYLVWSNEAQQWWKANGAGYTHRIFSAGRYNRAEAVKACNMRTWSLGTIPPEVMVPAPPAALLDAMQAIHDGMPTQIQAANIARIAEREAAASEPAPAEETA